MFRLTTEVVVWRSSGKKLFLEISQNSQESNCTRISVLIKLRASYNFIRKETLPQVFSCEFCEISKTIFFTEHVPATVITKTTDEPQTNHRQLQTSHRRVTDDYRRDTEVYFQPLTWFNKFICRPSDICYYTI